MGFLLLLVPCFIAGVQALDLVGRSGSPLPVPSPPVSNPPPSNSSSTPWLNFGTIPQLTTCESATFNWTYSDLTTQQLIISIVTDSNVSSSSGTPMVNRVISSTANPNLHTYTWPAVVVPQGWYTLCAAVPARSFNTTSAAFFVQTGSNVSCLISSALSSPTSSRASSNTAAIVGGVLGGTALVLIVAIILVMYRRNRTDKADSANLPDSGKRSPGRKSMFLFARQKSWDNLGSVDSHVGAAAPVAALKDSYSSQRLRYQHRHPLSQTSISDSLNLPVLEYGRNLSQRSFNGEKDSPRSRRPSNSSSLVASTALSHVMGPPPAIPQAGPPSYRPSSPAQTVPGSPEAGTALDLAPSSLPRIKPLQSRRSTRKPVPMYDASTDAASSSLALPSSSSLDATLSPLKIADDPFARPLPVALIHKGSTVSLDVVGSAASSGHGHGHYLSRSQSTNSGKDRGLTHKNSVGGFESRPMHYLIPDMPLPQN